MIGAGGDWKGEIDRNLASADIVLLLVSADFLASDYCWGEEMVKALQRHERGEARVIPVILRPCRWRSTPLAKLQAVPRDGKPVTDWLSRDTAFDDIAAAIERIIEAKFVGEAEPVTDRRETPAGIPQVWVLVAGTGARWQNVLARFLRLVGFTVPPLLELDEKLQQTCIALGESLARTGYGVVTGGWRGVDELTSRSFARELERAGLPLEDRLIQVVVEDELPAFPAGNLVLVHRGEEEWTESVKRADAVVLIGGVGGTWTTGEYGLKFGRIVFPLADTGGDAAKFYMHMQRHWKPEFLSGIDRSRFQVIATEAPQVVAGLIKLLDDWKRLQPHRM
jgi:hypothetical protein